MKNKLSIIIISGLLLLFSLAPPAQGAAEDKKQFLENYLQSTLSSSPYSVGEIVSGNLTISLEDLTTDSDLDPLISDMLEGSQLSLDYRLCPSQKKGESSFTLILNNNLNNQPAKLKGLIYLDQNRVIVPPDTVSAINQLLPDLLPDSTRNSSTFVCIETDLSNLWEGRDPIPAVTQDRLRQMLGFMLQPLDDKYFKPSGSGIRVNLDKNESPAVWESIRQSVKTDKAGFASRFTRLLYPEAWLSSRPEIDSMSERLPLALEKLNPGPQSKYPLEISSLDLTTGSPDSQLELEITLDQPDANGSFKYSSSVHQDGADYHGSCQTTFSLETESDEAYYYASRDDYKREGSSTSSQSQISLILHDSSDDDLGFTINCSLESRVETGAGITLPQVDDMNSITIRTSPLDIGAPPIKIIVDGKKQNLSEDLYTEKGNIMVPLRLISESLGCDVEWDLPNQVIICKDGKELQLKLDEGLCYQGTTSKQPDPPIVFKGNQLYVPLRFIAEELGYQVDFDPLLHTVVLTGPTNI